MKNKLILPNLLLFLERPTRCVMIFAGKYAVCSTIRVTCFVLAGSLAVANGADVIRADLYNLRFGTCVVGQS